MISRFLASEPVLAPVPCCICGDPVQVPEHASDDVVCRTCFERNCAGAAHFEHPPIGRLADIPAVRRRELQRLDAQRWPMTQGTPHG